MNLLTLLMAQDVAMQAGEELATEVINGTRRPHRLER